LKNEITRRPWIGLLFHKKRKPNSQDQTTTSNDWRGDNYKRWEEGEKYHKKK
jgi:hypothetical protein